MNFQKFTVTDTFISPSGKCVEYINEQGRTSITSNFGFKVGDVVEMWNYDGYAPTRIDINGINVWTEINRIEWWKNYDPNVLIPKPYNYRFINKYLRLFNLYRCVVRHKYLHNLLEVDVIFPDGNKFSCQRFISENDKLYKRFICKEDEELSFFKTACKIAYKLYKIEQANQAIMLLEKSKAKLLSRYLNKSI